MDELSLIEAVHFLAYISVEAPLGALPRGTASRAFQSPPGDSGIKMAVLPEHY